ncbi:hypothetical protein B0H13DRAFT_2063968 [Mycena leptocephala]|nr:hypothetical protein B0H13DRAFT_2063968 [Mycena leptocephala]
MAFGRPAAALVDSATWTRAALTAGLLLKRNGRRDSGREGGREEDALAAVTSCSVIPSTSDSALSKPRSRSQKNLKKTKSETVGRKMKSRKVNDIIVVPPSAPSPQNQDPPVSRHPAAYTPVVISAWSAATSAASSAPVFVVHAASSVPTPAAHVRNAHTLVISAPTTGCTIAGHPTRASPRQSRIARSEEALRLRLRVRGLLRQQ